MTDIQTLMGTLIIIFITLLAIADGVLLTYLVIERMALPARLCAGSVVGLALLSWIGFLISLLTGLNTISISLTVFIFIAGLIALFRFVDPGQIGKISVNRKDLVYYLAWMGLLTWLFSRVVMFYPDGLHTAPANNFGDLPFHFSVITSFAYGENLPPQNPIFAGMKFTYPFLIDFLTAFFMRCGADWRAAFFVENLVLSLSLVGLIDEMTMRLVKHRIAAYIAPVIFFFNGGLGFVNFFSDLGQFFSNSVEVKKGLIWFLAHLPNAYTMNADLILSSGKIPLRWGNVFTTLLIPQRSMLFGLPFVAMIVMLWWKAFGDCGLRIADCGFLDCGLRNADCGLKSSLNPQSAIRNPQSKNPHSAFRIPHSALVSAGLLAGLLPMLHAHGFFAVMMASVGMVLLFWSRDWIWFFAPVAALAAPQAFWLSGTQIRNKLFKIPWLDPMELNPQIFWSSDDGKSNPLIFWAVNAGVFILLLLVALSLRKLVLSPARRFYLPFLLWFIVPNVMLLAPWPWDNIKVLVYWALASCPLVAAALSFLFMRRFVVLRLFAAALLIILTFSGALDVLRALSPAENVRLFGKQELEVAALLREQTPPRSVILHAPIHNSVVALSGRQSAMGYPGHLWTHGIEYKQREYDVDRIYRGGPGIAEHLSRLNVDYVIFGPVERSQLVVDEIYFANLYPIVIDHGEYRVYRVRR